MLFLVSEFQKDFIAHLTLKDMAGRQGTNPPGGRPGSGQTRQFSELTASTDSHDPYWYQEEFLDSDDDYDDDDDDENPTSSHIENSFTSFHRPELPYRPSPSSARGQYGRHPRPSSISSSSVPHAQDPMTYQSPRPGNNPAGGLRIHRRRGAAREPRAHLSSIPENSASTTFPLTIQGPGQRIVRPLPPVPAGAGQQQQARGQATQGVEQISELTRLLRLKRKEEEEDEGAHGENRKNKG